VKVAVEASRGELASSPEEALAGLTRLAEADGADRTEWLEKAMRSGGAVRAGRTVNRSPRYQIVDDALDDAAALYHRAMTMAESELRELLDGAVQGADSEGYVQEATGGERT
tara:strand:+ start:2963 stop:3298 length:336 start_codon:yes stop_codon:yes gene_type:complete